MGKWTPTIEQHRQIADDIDAAEAAVLKVMRHRRFMSKRQEARLARLYGELGTLKAVLDGKLGREYPEEDTAIYYGRHIDLDDLEDRRG